MDARDPVRSVGVVGTARGLLSVRSAWRRWRVDAAAQGGGERARVPGAAEGAEPQPGGGVVRFARSTLRLRVAAGGAVFCGWDGAEPEPSYALAHGCPEVDARAELEPDTDGGWRVVSERATVTVSRMGAVEVRTPGGIVLRRDRPPRWWDRAEEEGPGVSRWEVRSQVPADARFFGLGGRTSGPRLRDGSYRLWNTDPGDGAEPVDDPPHITMPLHLVVADAGTHLVFHDNTWDGRVRLREGAEGGGSGHDRLGDCETRMDGGPLRFWVVVGSPARVLQEWTALTGAPALPPRWALGPHHARSGPAGQEEIRRLAAGYRERGLPLSAVHLDTGHGDRRRVFRVDRGRFPDLPELAERLREDGVRLVTGIGAAVAAVPGNALYAQGAERDAFVRDARGRRVRGPARAVFPDFTDPAVRAWWGECYRERLAQGFSGVWLDLDGSAPSAGFGEPALPRSARHDLEGRGGDHREAHNVYALAMARAGHEALTALRPGERPVQFSRAGWAGMQRYGGAWCGDVATDWAGLRATLSLVLGLGLCGVPYAGADVGGLVGVPAPELYLRWFQLGSCLPLFRTHSAGPAGRREPWHFGPEVLEHARSALRERMRLMPYFTTLAHLASRTGSPYVRPLWWASPRDRGLRDCEDAFLLGKSLLVAPVLEAGARRRRVLLPRGRWYDVASGAVHEGARWAELDAPLSRIPMLARAGSVLPVVGAGGGVELEAWAPAPGQRGAGLVVEDAGDGWEHAVVERYTTSWVRGEPVVEREGGGEVRRPVRVRGVAR